MKGSGVCVQLRWLQTHNTVKQPGWHKSPSGASTEATVPIVTSPICVCVHGCVCVVCACMHVQGKSGAVQQLRDPTWWSPANRRSSFTAKGWKGHCTTQSDPQTGQTTKWMAVTREEVGCHISAFFLLVMKATSVQSLRKQIRDGGTK